jgi:RNA polymerase sigma-70 factor (ECF subfamily)
LYELEEMTMSAVAETIGLPPGTVASRLRRARELFKESVERQRADRAHGGRR